MYLWRAVRSQRRAHRTGLQGVGRHRERVGRPRGASHPTHYRGRPGQPGHRGLDAQTLISDHVVAIADMSLVDETWASAVQKAGIPVVGVGTANNTFNTNPDFYPEAQTNDSAVYSNVFTAKAEGATKLAYFYCAEAATCAESLPHWKAVRYATRSAGRLHGLDPAANRTTPPSVSPPSRPVSTHCSSGTAPLWSPG